MAIVYRHIRLDTRRPFYIGIGVNKARAYSVKNRNKHWHNIVNKSGYEVQILFDYLTYEEAKEKDDKASKNFYKLVKYVQRKKENNLEKSDVYAIEFLKKYKLDLIDIP